MRNWGLLLFSQVIHDDICETLMSRCPLDSQISIYTFINICIGSQVHYFLVLGSHPELIHARQGLCH